MLIKYDAFLAHGDGLGGNQEERYTWYPSNQWKAREESTEYPRMEGNTLETLHFHVIPWKGRELYQVMLTLSLVTSITAVHVALRYIQTSQLKVRIAN